MPQGNQQVSGGSRCTSQDPDKGTAGRIMKLFSWTAGADHGSSVDTIQSLTLTSRTNSTRGGPARTRHGA